MQETRQQRRRRERRRLLPFVIIGSIVAVIVLAILIDSAMYYNKVHAGVSVAGISLSGQTKDEAVQILSSYVDKAQANPILLKSGDKSWTLMPADAGATIDVKKAVQDAMQVSRKGNIFSDLGKRLKLYFSKVNLPLEGTVDSAVLDSQLQKIAQELDKPPVNAALSMENGQIKTVESQSGTVVDQASLHKQLASLLLSLHSTEVSIPIVTKEPDVKSDDFAQALAQAKTMISAPLTVTNSGQSWVLTTDEIGQYMDFKSQDVNGVSTLVPYFSADKLAPFLDEIAPKVANPAVDAKFGQDGTKAWVVPAVLGEELDRDGTVEALTQAALTTNDRTVEAAVKTSDPKFTTDEANAEGIKDLLAKYTTPSYTGTANRQVNVRITTQYASNKFLAPGQEYDFDKTIGPRTVERGYKTAKGIVANGELDDVLGGGICQVSTTLFNAVFDAGLQVLERHNHSLYISHYPDGRDATVTGGGKNFRFKNDTGHYLWIIGKSDGITTTFYIYGTSDGRTVTSKFSGFSYGAQRTTVSSLDPTMGPGSSTVKIDGQSGRSCLETRTVKYADGTTHVDKFESYYPMIPKTIVYGPTTSTTIRPTTTTAHGSGTTVVTEF